jgi:hypothetical protein
MCAKNTCKAMATSYFFYIRNNATGLSAICDTVKTPISQLLATLFCAHA